MGNTTAISVILWSHFFLLFFFVVVIEFLGKRERREKGASGISPRCQCLFKEKRPIGRFISTVEIYPANSYCKSTEIIATLKKEGQKICLDPNAPWVKQELKAPASP
uniref:Chemokine interleukin-8-like domain-containing protein n=1 Tax=Oreochromis niloticus TaxID=8128 RepID=A0A669DEK6_ORENI